MQIKEYNCAVKHFKINDASIHNIMNNYGPIILKKKKLFFKKLVHSIVGQQLSVKAARSIINKLDHYFENNITPEVIINTDHQILRSLGLSNAKAKYVKDLSQKIINKEIKIKGISNKTDQEIEQELTKVKGIGQWTVHMFLIFVLGRPNVLPIGDLGIKKAIMLNYNLNFLPTSDFVLKLSQEKNWSPYNTYASLYLWKLLDQR